MGHIKFDKRNFRKHSEDNKSLIRKSLEQYGAGRSVVVDADDELIAGNGVYEQAEAMGIPTRVIETDGTELVVVKRTDLHTDDEKRKGLAAADNATSDKVEWNFDALRENFTPEELQAFRIEVPNLDVPQDNNGGQNELPDVTQMFMNAEDGGIANIASDKSDDFEVSFVFNKSQSFVLDYIKQNGKQEIINLIVELCQIAEVK